VSNSPFLARPRRALPLLVVGVIGLLAFVAVGVAVESALSPHKPENTRPPAADPLPGTSASAASTPSAVGSPGSGPLALVQGNALINGLHVGYPHSLPGAVSAAVEYWTQLGSTLDSDRAATIARLAANPTWTSAPATFAEGPTNTRQTLGLATSGPVPTGASVQLEPVEYQVRDASANTVTVLLLSDYTTTTTAEGTTTHVGVFPLDLIWTAGDWKIADANSQDDTSLAALPGSAQASADGWQEMTQ
jgi:hypothetical protein